MPPPVLRRSKLPASLAASWLSPRLLVIPVGALMIAIIILSFGMWTLPAAAVIIVGIVAFLRLDWALYALVFLLPVTAIKGMSAGHNQTVQGFKRLLILELALAWLVHLFVTRRPVYLPRRVLVPLMLFSTAALASILRAPEPKVALTSTGRLLSYCLVYVVITMNVIRSPQDVWRVIRVLLVAAALTSLFAVYQLLAHFVGWNTLLNPSYEVVYLIPRVHGFMTEPLHLANFLLLVCPIAIALYAWRVGTWPLLTGSAGALSLIGIVLAASRSGWGVLVLSALLFLGLEGSSTRASSSLT